MTRRVIHQTVPRVIDSFVISYNRDELIVNFTNDTMGIWAYKFGTKDEAKKFFDALQNACEEIIYSNF